MRKKTHEIHFQISEAALSVTSVKQHGSFQVVNNTVSQICDNGWYQCDTDDAVDASDTTNSSWSRKEREDMALL